MKHKSHGVIRCALVGMVVFMASAAKAGTYCYLQDVPKNEVVIGEASTNCTANKKNLSTKKFTGTTSDVAVCAYYNQARDYRDDGSLIFPPERFETTGNKVAGVCDRSAYIRHLSKISSTAGACNGKFNIDDLRAYGIVVTDVASDSSCAPPEVISSSYKLYTLKKMSSSSSADDVCYYGKTYVPNGWVITAYGNECEGETPTKIGGSEKTSVRIEKIPATGSKNICELPNDVNSNYVFTLLANDVCNDNSVDYSIAYKKEGYSCIVPSGMVATSVSSTTYCTGPTYYVEYPKNGTVACAVDGSLPNPNNFVVSQVGAKSTCKYGNGDDKTWTLKTPASGVKVCLNYGKPDSWGLKSYSSNDSACKKANTSSTVSTPSAVLTGLAEGAVYCTKPSLPQGWVFTSIQAAPNILCSTGKYYEVGTPGSGETPICYISGEGGPVPPGYMISSNQGGGTTCVDGSAMVIEPVRDGLQVCDLQNLPADFGVSATYGADSNCSLHRYSLERVSGDGPYFSCSNQPVPVGYVVTAVGDFVDCGSNIDSFQIERPDPNASTEVCMAQSLDSILLNTNLGLVVLGYNDSNTSCSGATAYLIGSPKSSGNTTICTTDPKYLPDGYVLVESGLYSDCGGGSGSIIKRDTQEIVPQTYVDPELNVGPQDLNSVIYDCGSNTSSAVINGASRNSIACP